MVAERVRHRVGPRELDEAGTYRETEPTSGQRFRITYILIGITAFLAVAMLAAAVWAPDAAWERVDRVATLTFVPFLTLVGTAVGWYFGEKKSSS